MYIHECQDWPHFRWDSESLSLPLSTVRYRQGLLIGRMKTLGFELRAEATLECLTEDILKSSAIEGEDLNQDQVRSSIARNLGIEVGGVISVDRHVEGFVQMMLDATQKCNNPLTKERLFGWHGALFPTGRSGLLKITVGHWRTQESGPMQIVSGPYGREKVHFEAPEGNVVEREMDEFLTWFNGPQKIDPVLKAGIAHFWFVTIHPFEDGNGRIARAIADLCLARADGISERFYSLSSQIALERKEYYSVLELCQKGSLDITPWLRWFLDCLGVAIDDADKTLDKVLFKARVWQKANNYSLNERQRKIISKLLEGFEGNLTTSKYSKITKCSQDTALRDIRELMEYGILKQWEGGGRSTSYGLSA